MGSMALLKLQVLRYRYENQQHEAFEMFGRHYMK